MLRTVLLFAALTALAACSSSSTATTDDKAPAPASIVAKVKTFDVTLDPSRIEVNEEMRMVTLKPITNVQRASYTTWIFPLANYKKAVGGKLDKPMVVKVQLLGQTTRTQKPDPSMPQPEGGIKHYTKHGEIILATE